MTKRFSRWLLIALMALSMPALAPSGAYAWLGGGYWRWYGWAGPLYGGFGGYPGARYVSGYGGGWGSWGCDCWSGCAVGMDVEPSPSQGMGPTTTTPPGNSVIMNVTVPPEAVVYINGRATSSLGSQRRFRSDNLQPGTSYPYQVRAEIERDGQKLVQSKTIQLRPGSAESVAFDFSQPATDPNPSAETSSEMLTSLTLRVPQGAKVFLGDNPTRSTGTLRRFATTLKAGQRYSDYKVRVEAKVGGKLQTREQVISLAAGEKRELSFDFAAGGDPLVAANGSR